MARWPTAGSIASWRNIIFGSSPTTSCAAKSSGKRAAPRAPASPAQNFSGGITCTRPPTGRLRRGRCIPPTAARSSTSPRTRFRSATKSSVTSGRFRFPRSGVRWRASRRPSGSRDQRSGLRRNTSRISRSFTCRTLTTISSASVPTIRGSRKIAARSIAWRAG